MRVRKRRPPTGTASVRLRQRRSIGARPRRCAEDSPARTTPDCRGRFRPGRGTMSTALSWEPQRPAGPPGKRNGWRSGLGAIHSTAAEPRANRPSTSSPAVSAQKTQAVLPGVRLGTRGTSSELRPGRLQRALRRPERRRGHPMVDPRHRRAPGWPTATAAAGLAPNPLVSARRPPGGSPSARPTPRRQVRRARAEHQRWRRRSSIPPRVLAPATVPHRRRTHGRAARGPTAPWLGFRALRLLSTPALDQRVTGQEAWRSGPNRRSLPELGTAGPNRRCPTAHPASARWPAT